ncbi:MAG: hypothetical protein CM1200mP24_08430 [Gammaproteobacteria bacterium]|nr:MAG: hypothetical protein CM1200mP24_08430 [Gammaproteobacteria bacterium]
MERLSSLQIGFLSMLELQKHSKTFSALFLGICLLGCVSHTVRTVDLTPPAQSTWKYPNRFFLISVWQSLTLTYQTRLKN